MFDIIIIIIIIALRKENIYLIAIRSLKKL
jgi:hypothetical protein